jgi:hypothetical protein
MLHKLESESREKWLRLLEQISPIDRWTADGLRQVRNSQRWRSTLATNRPLRSATRSAPWNSPDAARLSCGGAAKYLSSGVSQSRLEWQRAPL